MSVTPLPFGPDDITPEWLTEALQVRHPGTHVASVHVRESRHVTNTHSFLEVAYDGATAAPTALFCKMLPLAPDRRELLRASEMGPKEVHFYNDLQPLVPHFRVPAIHVAVTDPDDGSFVMLMEDLEGNGCLVPDGTWGIGADAMAVALEELARMHVRFEDPEVRARVAPWAPIAREGRAYALAPLRNALDHHPGNMAPEFARGAALYLERAQEMIVRWADGPGPATIVHGDPHLGNLFLDGDRVGFLDWGVINVTTPIRDAGYFIAMAMQPEDRRAHERDLLRHYLDVRVALGGAPIGFDDAWLAHRFHSLYCVPAACQTIVVPETATERRKVFAASYLRRAEAAVADLDPFGALAELERRD